MQESQTQLKLAYYGDDFTGSTDALDFLSRAGIKTLLFLEAPSPHTLNALDGVQAIGVAGRTRSLPKSQLRDTLREDFSALAKLHPEVIHYKVCSTFDSSPETGNIGCALECGQAAFPGSTVPVIVGNPTIGRYSVFGNLFAHMGTAIKGPAYRLDVHPSMSRHPVTPAKDGNLLDHLARQTQARTALLDVLSLNRAFPECKAALQDIISRENPDAVFFDVLEEEHLDTIGKLLGEIKSVKSPLFVIGSSAVEAALCKSWQETSQIPQSHTGLPSGPALIVSGSCSPVTAHQIKAAVSDGFAELAIDPDGIWRTKKAREIGQCAARQLALGRSVIIHSCIGPADQRLDGCTQSDRSHVSSALGTVLASCLEEQRPAGICIAGGDTSSELARYLGLQAMTFAQAFVPGAPLCKAFKSAPLVNGQLFNFKGGQVGSPEYFVNFRKLFS